MNGFYINVSLLSEKEINSKKQNPILNSRYVNMRAHQRARDQRAHRICSSNLIGLSLARKPRIIDVQLEQSSRLTTL
jgi:hypothetical protein